MASKHALEKIVSERILSDPSAQRKYTGGRVKTPSGKYETRLREHIHHHALCKMLTLVTYLDVAKENKILSDVCLFDKESNIKSSNAILASICRICFARKELIINHMANLFISVAHVQNPLEEYEYYIKNLSVDLKDGVRLAKMLEILTGRSLLPKMRLPATSRGNRIHNVGEVLSALHEEGVSNIDDVTAAHIVDAHQPRILQLLWNTIMHFQMGTLERRAIVEEIRSVGNWIERKQGGGMLNDYQGVNKPCLSNESETSSRDQIERLLLTWCQTVCSFYHVPVENFADSFCDGKVLCLLVSFYHPTLLPSRDILPTAADVQSKLKPGVQMNDQLVRMTLQNEMYNFSLALNRINELGGVPRLFSSKEFLLPPDDKSMLLFVSFLFSRLTETNREYAAAREIQCWWQRLLNQKKYEAAVLILNQWRQCKENYFLNQRHKFASSVRVIEKFYRRHEEQFKALARASTSRKKRDESAVQIQVRVFDLESTNH
jgi:abnormal spindle-like microcephaly-associated protein